MITGKMEAIEKRFKFYQKSIFFSDFNIEHQQGKTKRNLIDQPAINLNQTNSSINRTQLAKPPKTTSSIQNNSNSFYSPKTLHRPVTVNPTQVYDPKNQFVENAKHFKTETYLSRLLKTENNKKLQPKPLLQKNINLENETPLKFTSTHENVKIKQHHFK